MNEIRARLARSGLVRAGQDRLFAGVCAGIARKAGVPPLVVRLVFVASVILPGSQLLVYALLWWLMPDEDQAIFSSQPVDHASAPGSSEQASPTWSPSPAGPDPAAGPTSPADPIGDQR